MPKPTVAQVRLIVAILERGGTDVPGVDLFHYRKGIKAATSTIESCKRHGWITRDEQANWTVTLKGRADAANCFTTYPTPVDLAVTRGELKSAPLVRGNATPASLLRQPQRASLDGETTTAAATSLPCLAFSPGAGHDARGIRRMRSAAGHAGHLLAVGPDCHPDMPAPATSEQTGHVVVIDSPQRIKAVAGLARRYRHAGARTAIRDLAVAVGVECRGGRIYPPRGWSNCLARGWDRFVEEMSYSTSDLRWLAERMADHGAKTGATVTIGPALAAQIRAARDVARERTITEASATTEALPGAVAEERCPDPECGEPLTDIAAGRVGHCGRTCAPTTDGLPNDEGPAHLDQCVTDGGITECAAGCPRFSAVRFPEGTPEYEAYRTELLSELEKWAHGETR